MTESCTSEEFNHFLANKQLLDDCIKEGKSLKNRQDDCAIGLLNAGSTCYLNAVTQCLFQSKHFRTALCATQETSSPVINELKRLFTFLSHSSRSAVSTKDLLAAFGWTKSQAHEQHDAHEFYSILLDAIGQGSKDIDAKLSELFQGTESDILQCSNCNFEKASEANFRTLSVDIPDVLEGEVTEGQSLSESFSIVNLLCDTLKPETLDDQNKWECSSCAQKVCATKRRGFKSIPECLVVQLKRFRFDPTTKKRRKLNTAIDFPEKIVPSTLLQIPGGSSEPHVLTGIIVHMGTAMGGHYKSYVRSAADSTVWWECNDDQVQKLSAEEIALLFSADNQPDSIQRGTIMENAYVLVYSKLSGDQSISEFPVSSEVQEDNRTFETLVKLDKIRKQVVQCEIVLQKIVDLNPSDNKLTMHFPRQATIAEVSQQIYNQATSTGLLDGSSYPIQQCRVRKFTKTGWGKGETFAGRESASLGEAGFSENETICFEYRSPEDIEFVEFNPQDMILHIRKWTNIEDFADQAASDADKRWVEILVPGRETASVGALRNTVCTVLGLAANSFYLIPFDPSVPLFVLDEDSADLRKKHKVVPGSHVIVEEKVGESESIAYVALKNVRSRVRLHFNNPFETADKNYENVIETRIDASLLEAKNQIATHLNIPNLDSFHLRKNESGPQFKDENKSLGDLELTDLSIVHVELGKGCSAGEHMLRFEIDLGAKTSGVEEEGDDADKAKAKSDVNRYILLDEIAVSDKSTILAIKKQLHAQWNELSAKLEKRLQSLNLIQAVASPGTPHHIRLRDLKTGKVSGPLRDDRIASRCLLGLGDGRRIAVQILPNEEIIGPDDILITIRVASYDKKTLAEPHDMCIPRNFTVENLYDKISQTFPELAEEVPPTEGVDPATELPIEIAKGFTTGPAVSLKTALKLKWNDPAVMVEGKTSLVDRPPLNLRDGSIIVVRGRADWLRAQARVKAKRDAEMAAGTGVSAVRAKSRAGTRGGARAAIKNRMATSATEPTLKIASGDVSASRPPHPDGIAGSPNENISENQLPQPSPTKLQ